MSGDALFDCSRDDVCHVRWRTEAEVPVSAPVEGRLTGGSAAEVGIAEKDIGRRRYVGSNKQQQKLLCV